VLPNSVAPEPTPATAELSNVKVSLDEAARGAKITERVVQERGEQPELAEAAIVVAGGRGVSSAGGFELTEKHGQQGMGAQADQGKATRSFRGAGIGRGPGGTGAKVTRMLRDFSASEGHDQ
jgi:hypothetical protein